MASFIYNENTICSNCSTAEHLVEDVVHASLVCTKCGMEVLSKMLSAEKDWNNYGNGVDNSRVSAKPDNPFSTCGTYIAPGTYIVCGINPDGTKRKMDLGKMHIRMFYTPEQRSYDSVAKEFEKLENHLPQSVIITAKRYWGKIMKGNIHRGANREGIIASCILYACYENKCSRTRNDIASIMGIDKESITKGEYLFIDMVKDTKIEYVLKMTSDIEQMFHRYINKFCLRKKFKYEKMCIELYKKHKKHFVNMKPTSVVGGIICYVLRESGKLKSPPTKKTICGVVGVSDPTINKAVKKIKQLEN